MTAPPSLPPTDEERPTNEHRLDDFDGGRPMTILEHLQELRSRLIWCVVALVIGVVIASIITNDLIDILLQPAKDRAPTAEIVQSKVLGNFTTFFKVALYAGVGIAMPVWVYQTLMFVLPGLTPQEKRWVIPVTVGIFVCFAAGIAFAYVVILPQTMGFLLNFNKDQFRPLIQAQDYLDFTTRLLFWIGASFQTPLFILALARFGIVSGPKLLGWWRYMIVVVFLVAAVVTPTPDPLTQTMVAGPLLVLYLVGVVLAYIFGRERRR